MKRVLVAVLVIAVLWMDWIFIEFGTSLINTNSNGSVFVGILFVVVPLYLTVVGFGATINRWWCDRMEKGN